jgi:hypothetical protein
VRKTAWKIQISWMTSFLLSIGVTKKNRVIGGKGDYISFPVGVRETMLMWLTIFLSRKYHQGSHRHVGNFKHHGLRWTPKKIDVHGFCSHGTKDQHKILTTDRELLRFWTDTHILIFIFSLLLPTIWNK